QLERAGCRARDRHGGGELVVGDLLAAEGLVVFYLPGRKLGGPGLRLLARGRDLDARAVQVVAVGDLPGQAHPIAALGERGEAERLVGGQEVVALLRLVEDGTDAA